MTWSHLFVNNYVKLNEKEKKNKIKKQDKNYDDYVDINSIVLYFKREIENLI